MEFRQVQIQHIPVYTLGSFKEQLAVKTTKIVMRQVNLYEKKLLHKMKKSFFKPMIFQYLIRKHFYEAIAR